MRPDRAIVKKAIADAGNNLTKAAALLGCSRTALYTWIYQLGLERFAGVCLDTRTALDRRDRKDSPHGEAGNKTNRVLTQAPGAASILRVVQPAAVVDLPLNATVKLPESLWKEVKIRAIREGCTVSDLVERSLKAALADAPAARRRNGKKEDER